MTIQGKCIAAGTDEAGIVRLVIQVSREDLRNLDRNIVYQDVSVQLPPIHRDGYILGPGVGWGPVQAQIEKEVA